MMKGDAMRRSGELLMILQWIAAFVGIWGFFLGPYTMASIQTGLWGSAKVLGSSFSLYLSTKTR